MLGEDTSPQAVGRRGNVRIGLRSWSDPSLIKSKAFYPRGTGTPEGRLRFYALNFPVVEVDNSFYAMPDPANAAMTERSCGTGEGPVTILDRSRAAGGRLAVRDPSLSFSLAKPTSAVQRVR